MRPRNNLNTSILPAIKGDLMKYLKWHGNSIYCSYPAFVGKHWYNLGIKTVKKTKSERDFLLRTLGLPMLRRIQLAKIDARVYAELYRQLFEKPLVIEEPGRKKHTGPRRMTYRRHAARYWWYRLRKTASAMSMRYHLLAGIKEIGDRYADSITGNDLILLVEKWKKNVEVNTINNRLVCIIAVYNFACRTTKRGKLSEPNDNRTLTANPTKNIMKLGNGSVRQFLLTAARFERNFNWLYARNRTLARLYLVNWETVCRPLEGAGYRIEWIDWHEQGICIPSRIAGTKNGKAAWVPISDRAMKEIQNEIGNRKEGLIFRNENGLPWLYYNGRKKLINNTQWYFRELRAAFPDAGVFRDTRRGKFTIMANGYGLHRAMSLSRHKTASIALRYNVTERDDLREMVGASRKHGNVVEFQRVG